MKLVTLIGDRTNWQPLGTVLAAPSLSVRILQGPASGLAPAILDTTDVFVLDIDCDEMPAAEFIRCALRVRPEVQVLVVAESRHPNRLAVLEAGAAGLLRAPIDALELVASVHGALKSSSGSGVADILNDLPLKVALINRQNEILYLNRQAAKFWRSESGIQLTLPERDAAWLDDVERRSTGGSASPPLSVALTSSSGRPFPHLALVASAPNAMGTSDARLLLAVPTDETSLPDARDEFGELLLDLNRLIKISETRRQSCALHIVHVGGLADTNRAYGRIIGDRMMEGIEQRLLAISTQRNLIVGRLAGDEFAVLQTVAQQADVQLLAAEVLAQTNCDVDCAGQPLVPHISLGVAVSPRDGTDAFSLVRAAKHALLQARATVEDSPIAYSSPLAMQQPRVQLGPAFSRALDANELEFFYQPQVNLKTGRYDGVEALLRWPRGERGDVPPSDILAVAEQEDLLEPLTAWTCCQLAEDQRRLLDAGLPAMRLSLHLSTEQLSLPRLPALLRTLRSIAVHGMDVLVSSDTMERPTVTSVLQRLRDLDIGCCLNLSASDMDRLEIPELASRLKIDAREEARLEQVLNHASARALPVIGGNIEEATQLVTLRERNGETAQGYYIQAPVSLTDMISILRSDLSP